MEPHSQTNDSPESKQVLEGQLRQCFGRVVYSHKTQEKCADILLNTHARIKLWQIILSALTTAGCVSVLFSEEKMAPIIASLVSATLLFLNLYQKNYNLVETAQKHKQAANDLWLVREKYQSLITDLVIGNKTLEIIQEKRDILMKELDSVYSSAPSTNSKAYKKAQKALKQNEDMTFSDEEIDMFLPKELKRS